MECGHRIEDIGDDESGYRIQGKRYDLARPQHALTQPSWVGGLK